MSGLLEQCESVFQTDNLYTVLGVKEDATQQEVKKAYYRRSMAWHPDKAEDKQTATEKFKVLGRVYAILSDTDRRKVYDDTGSVDEECSSQDKDWQEYWRLLFPKVTEQDILDFEQKYRGSDEEKADLKAAYLESQGDMEHILWTVLCCSYEDEDRFAQLLTDMIQEGTVPDFDAFSKENKKKKKERVKKAKREAAEAEEMSKKLKVGHGQDSLMAAIAQRQAARSNQANDFFAQLEAKYGGKSGGKKKTKR